MLNISEMALINDMLIAQRDTHAGLSFMWHEYNNLALKVQALELEDLPPADPAEMDHILSELGLC